MANLNIDKNVLKAQIELEVLRCHALEDIDSITIDGCEPASIEWDRETDYQNLEHKINLFCEQEGVNTDDLNLGFLSSFVLPSKDGIRTL